MTSPSESSFADRIATVQRDIRARELDGLIVTYLPNVRYLTGFNGTAGMIVLTDARCVLLVDSRYETAARDLSAELGGGIFEVHRSQRTYEESLVGLLQQLTVARVGIEGASMTVNRFNWLTADLEKAATAKSGILLVATDRMIERRRAIKDASEIATLKEAARRLSSIARELPSLIGEGRPETAVAADIDAAIRGGGFDRPAFDTIVASGANSALPHARPGSRRLQSGDGVLLDFGGIYDGYCVDLTRTLQVGRVDPAFRRLFAAVREAHSAAISAVRPGTRPSQIDAAARDVLTRHGLGDAFGHGTGHGLGLEIHEDPRISKLPAAWPDDPVEPGMVFTIEPGAYVPGLGGVRIEDDVLVTPDGCEVLTDVPIEL